MDRRLPVVRIDVRRGDSAGWNGLGVGVCT